MADKKVRKWDWHYAKEPHRLNWQFLIHPPHEDDWFDDQWAISLILFGYCLSFNTYTEKVRPVITGKDARIFIGGKEVGYINSWKIDSQEETNIPEIKPLNVTGTMRFTMAPISKEEFKVYINSLPEDKDKELAARWEVSKSTVKRWRNGIACPHPALRRIIMEQQ